MYLLDTNIMSELRRPRPHAGLIAWLSGVAPDQVLSRRSPSENFRRRYVHAVILGSKERQLHLFEDTALPVDLPAAALK
jgi:predicted nucleic acid-binding protein